MPVVPVIDKLRRRNLQLALLAHQHDPPLQRVQHCLYLLAVQRLLGVVNAQQQVFVGILRQPDIDFHLRRLGYTVKITPGALAGSVSPAQAVGEDHRQRRLSWLSWHPSRQINAGKRQMVECAKHVVLQRLARLTKLPPRRV